MRATTIRPVGIRADKPVRRRAPRSGLAEKPLFFHGLAPSTRAPSSRPVRWIAWLSLAAFCGWPRRDRQASLSRVSLQTTQIAPIYWLTVTLVTPTAEPSRIDPRVRPGKRRRAPSFGEFAGPGLVRDDLAGFEGSLVEPRSGRQEVDPEFRPTRPEGRSRGRVSCFVPRVFRPRES